MTFGTPILAGTETGTEHDINLAYEAWKKTSKKPQILIYFKKAAPEWDSIEPDQFARVKNFKKEFSPGGRYEQGKYEEFVALNDFKEKLRANITGHLPKHLGGLTPSPGGFDFAGYRTKFGYEPKWDLSNIGVAQAPGDAPVSPTLEQIYQELRLGDKFEPQQLGLGAPLLPDEVATLADRIILIGAAGAGKTTWIRHTFFQLLQRRDVCPFLIELRRVARTLQHRKTAAKVRSLVGYLKAALEEMDCNAEGLAEALKDENGPRPILLVDGWDELGGLGREFRQKLDSFVRSHPRVGVIATSRPYGLEKPDAHDGFSQRYVQPLNDEEIEAFSNRFWAICYGKDPKHGESAQRFLASLASAASARALARHPCFAR